MLSMQSARSLNPNASHIALTLVFMSAASLSVCADKHNLVKNKITISIRSSQTTICYIFTDIEISPSLPVWIATS